MKYKKFGNTGLEVSALSIGTWGIGGAGWGDIKDEESINAIHCMFDHGVNLIDTAPVYGLGHSEEIVGKALKGYRDKVYLVTKGGITRKKATGFGAGEGPVRDSSKPMLLKQVEESLTRLGTDYLDVYLIHWPDVNTPFEETVDALNTLKQQGKIRFGGMCNFDVNQVKLFYDLGGLDVAQYQFSMLDQSNLNKMKTYQANGVGTMAYGALGGGILTGAFRSVPDLAKDDMRLNFYHFFEEPQFSKTMKLLDILDQIAAEHHVPVAQVTCNWTMQQSCVSTMLAGVSKVKHAEMNCAAAEWELSEKEIEIINKAKEVL